jgi:hypothetical protein
MNSLLHLYLQPWQRFAPMENLLSAFAVSRCVASIVKALSWNQTVSRLAEPFREKYDYIVPELLREFLEYEKKLGS